MFVEFLKRGSRFAAEKRGAVLVLFAAVILPILLLIAVAIDYSQFLVMKRQLQSAADAAALDLGTAPADLSLNDAKARALALLQANYPAAASIGSMTSFQVSEPDTETIIVTATGSLNTTFLKIAGYDTLNVTVTSQALKKQSKLELVLVLDNTGSMQEYAGTQIKIDALKQAATTLITTLMNNQNSADFVKIGVVPFTDAVNIGATTSPPWWLDTAGVAPLNKENLNLSSGQSLYSLFQTLGSQISSMAWQGCVRQRLDSYDLVDTATSGPSASDPSSVYVPYFAPDEPDTTCSATNNQSFSNSYLYDNAPSSATTPLAIQQDITKYNPATRHKSISGKGPNANCPISQLLPLTNQSAPLLTEINAMTPSGSTILTAGLTWGWHMLSPNGWFTVAPYNAAQPAAYTDQNTIKVIVLVTDGQNDVSGGGNCMNKSTFGSYGYAATGGQMGTNMNPGGPEAALDQKLLTLCSNIKSDLGNGDNRIIIYTIGLGVTDYSAGLLTSCATDPNHYFNTPDAGTLGSVFESIAIGLNQLRISH